MEMEMKADSLPSQRSPTKWEPESQEYWANVQDNHGKDKKVDAAIPIALRVRRLLVTPQGRKVVAAAGVFLLLVVALFARWMSSSTSNNVDAIEIFTLTPTVEEAMDCENSGAVSDWHRNPCMDHCSYVRKDRQNWMACTGGCEQGSRMAWSDACRPKTKDACKTLGPHNCAEACEQFYNRKPKSRYEHCTTVSGLPLLQSHIRREIIENDTK
jgi:hypothetical protein